MPQSFKPFRRTARLRALLAVALVLFVAACDKNDAFNPDTSIDPNATGPTAMVGDDETQIVEVSEATTANASFSGGIPFGHFAQPVTTFGSRYNGSKLTVAPSYLVKELSGAKSRGGKVVLMLAGNSGYYQDAGGRFSMDKWKARVNRFKNINFGSYISDGTVVGHFLMDEPNDPANWNGRPVTPAEIEEMARYSKQLWPSMPTIVRVEPSYLSKSHKYLDAAWAQYLYRRGNASDYIRRVVSDASSRGLALVVGLNVIHGGNPQGTKMTASEVESWGSALLSSSYPCAFISWQYSSSYLNSSGIPSAMDALRRKAESRGAKSCRG